MYVEMASRKRLDRAWKRRDSTHESRERDSDNGFAEKVVVVVVVMGVRVVVVRG